MLKNTACNFSTVKNTSGTPMVFSFLPPHGRELDVDEEYVVFGDIRQSIVNNFRDTAQRVLNSFDDALAQGYMIIVSTPSPILESPNGTGYMLAAANGGALSGVAPCWNSTTSESLPAAF